MRILWVSDSPSSPSGFGAVTREVCSRLARAGHQVEILGWQTRVGETRWQGIPVRPVRRQMFGADVLLSYLLRQRPNVVITLADVWWMSFMADAPIQDYLDRSGTRWLHYYPVDGADADGRLPSGWTRVLETADARVAMSRFGLEVSRASGVDAAYIPHGVDTAVFRPPADKRAAKARFGYEDRFVVLSDARNQPRKLLPRVLEVAAEFCATHPGALFHLHADPADLAARSPLYDYRVLQDRKLLGADDCVRFTEGFRMRAGEGLSAADLAGLYAAADAHLLGSWGEGFGLPNLQASSAGLVPMAVGYSASRELVEGHGYALRTESSVIDEFGLVRCLFDRREALEALDELATRPAELARRSSASRAFAEPYDWDLVGEVWVRVLEGLPARRRPSRSLHLHWQGREPAGPASELPPAVQEAARTATAALPEGATVSFQLTERRVGAVAAEIQADAFRKGDLLSFPVRLAPLFDEAPRAPVGRLLVSPGDLPAAAAMTAIFPRVRLSLPKPPEDPTGRRFLSLEQLIPTLPHYALVVDLAGECPAAVDAACAALGVPYLGESPLWAPVPGPPVMQIRRVLTDQGLSEARRLAALAALRRQAGEEPIEQLRAYTLARQPEATAPASAPSDPAGGELLLIRARTAGERPALARHVAGCGWLVLMEVGADGLVVAVGPDGRERLEADPQAAFVGGITLDEDADVAYALKRRFAEHVSQQIIKEQALEA